MAWPSASDYFEAVQNPPTAFAEPALKQGIVEPDKHGLPRARTGNFACVFKMSSGGRDWALRCFLREVADQQQRYAAISQHLQSARLPYVASFNFQPKGIRVWSSWFPILKMEWVYGEPLDAYIKKHLDDPRALRSLASRWVALVKALRAQHIAHGDLQHGNILATEDELRLVDYDGMYVPELQGRQSAERGHPNYQPPSRRDEDFGPYLDNFSALVIYTSILALSVDPRLWDQLRGGDEALLFRAADFKDPSFSRAFQLLQNCGEATVRDLTSRLQRMLLLDLTAMPPLDEGMGWPRRGEAGETERLKKEVQRPSGEEWWREHLTPPATVRLTPPRLQEQVVVALISLAGGFLAGATVDMHFSRPFAVTSGVLATALLICLFCIIRFRRLPELAIRLDTLARVQEAAVELRGIESAITSLLEERNRVDIEEKNQLAALSEKQDQMAQRERAGEADVDKELSVLLAKLAPQQGSLRLRQTDELSKAVRQMQEDYFAKALARYPIGKASLQGIGDELKRRLHAHGISTAADIVDVIVGSTGWGRYSHPIANIRTRGGGSIRVPGIGPSKAQVLKDWRQSLETICRRGMPSSLPGDAQAKIVARFEQEKRRLEEEVAKSREIAKQRKERIRSDFSQQQAAIARETQKAREACVKARGTSNLKVRETEERKLRSERALSALERELARYNQVTFAKFLRTYLGA